MDYTNKQIALEDNNTYVVIEQVEYNNSIYLYIANELDEDDTKFVEIKDNEIKKIDEQLFKSEILPLFVDKFSN